MNQTDHNRQNKIAVINDFSGFGRCSIAVSLPIISQLEYNAVPFPHLFFLTIQVSKNIFLKITPTTWKNI